MRLGLGRAGNVSRLTVLAAVLGIIIPTVGILWLTNVAVRNERLAVREHVVAACESEVHRARDMIERSWVSRLRTLESLTTGEAVADALFLRLVNQRGCSGAVIFDQSGRVCFPRLSPVDPVYAYFPPAWRSAEKAEFVEGNFEKAAGLYRKIGLESWGARTYSAQARIAESRCLARLGRHQKAVDLLLSTFPPARRQLHKAPDGRLLDPEAWMLALPMMRRFHDKRFALTSQALYDCLTSPDPSVGVRSSQRLALLRQLHELDPKFPLSAAFQAEELAISFVDLAPEEITWESENRPGDLRPTHVPGIWGTTLARTRVMALYRADHLESWASSVLAEQFPSDLGTIRFEPANDRDAGAGTPDRFQLRARSPLSGWRLTLTLKGSDSLEELTRRETTLRIWTAILLCLGILCSVLLAVGFAGRQVRLANLKNDFVATVSHELKTPVASVRVLLDTLIEDRLPSEEQKREYLELISRENERLAQLIDNLLCFSRLERGKHVFSFMDIRPEEVTQLAFQAVEARFKLAAVDFRYEAEAELPPVWGDREGLVRAVVNLLDNALKYTPDEKQIFLRVKRAGQDVSFEVQDNGIGISRKAARRVFERFYQADRKLSRKSDGCGLGLSIVKLIVKAHKGRVSVESEPGAGSLFRIVLPASPGSRAS
ncbi:MAG: sensor histidine kinase [Acidobacteriota bacterium]